MWRCAYRDATGVLTAEGARGLLLVEAAANVARSHKYPAAVALADRAAADGHRGVAVGSCGNYGLAVALACRRIGLHTDVTVPAAYRAAGRRIAQAGATVVEVGGTYEDAVAVSRIEAARRGLADGNVDGPYAPTILGALGGIVEELAAGLPSPPAAVWVPVGNGTTAAAVGQALLAAGWPTRLVGSTSVGNNAILASWPARRHTPLDPERLRPTEVNEPLVNWRSLHGDQALAVIHATGGCVLGVTDRQLIAAQHALALHCGIAASPAGAAAVAAFRAAPSELRMAGTHVVILSG